MLILRKPQADNIEHAKYRFKQTSYVKLMRKVQVTTFLYIACMIETVLDGTYLHWRSKRGDLPCCHFALFHPPSMLSYLPGLPRLPMPPFILSHID